jgi:hypothetical protein
LRCYKETRKQINYRGGVVRFFIPKHWIEEYEKDGGGTFYEPGDDAGTLRLNVLSFLTKEDVSLTYPLETFKLRCSKYNGIVEELSDSRSLLKYSIKGNEHGEDLIIFYWEVARMVSPRDYNIAVFSFTVTALQARSPAIIEAISSLEEEVKDVQFWIHGDAYEP